MTLLAVLAILALLLGSVLGWVSFLKLSALRREVQVLLNLILNAADAMPNGGTLQVTTGCGSDDSTVTIELCDDGVGLAPDTGDKIFDPFYTTKREGVGLGLVNTKSIVERHGGTIRLTARNGKGTRAVITLPSAGRAAEPAKSD